MSQGVEESRASAIGWGISPADKLFHRHTDEFVAGRIGKQSLDVGADRIARTARAALCLLNRLRKETGVELMMASGAGPAPGHRVIEVYPAATLKAHGWRSSGYKGKEDQAKRREILEEISQHIVLSDGIDRRIVEAIDDVLDALICLLVDR